MSAAIEYAIEFASRHIASIAHIDVIFQTEMCILILSGADQQTEHPHILRVFDAVRILRRSFSLEGKLTIRAEHLQILITEDQIIDHTVHMDEHLCGTEERSRGMRSDALRLIDQNGRIHLIVDDQRRDSGTAMLIHAGDLYVDPFIFRDRRIEAHAVFADLEADAAALIVQIERAVFILEQDRVFRLLSIQIQIKGYRIWITDGLKRRMQACPIQTQRIAVGLIALNERTVCLQIIVVLLIFDRAFVHLIKLISGDDVRIRIHDAARIDIWRTVSDCFERLDKVCAGIKAVTVTIPGLF